MLCATALAVAVVACGAKTATRTNVIARGNGICTAALDAIRSVPPPAGATATELSTYLARVRPIVEREATQLAGLPRPAERRATLNSFVTAFTATDRAYRTAAAAAARGDATGAVSALSALRSSRVSALARRYGLTDCTGEVATR